MHYDKKKCVNNFNPCSITFYNNIYYMYNIIIYVSYHFYRSGYVVEIQKSGAYNRILFHIILL